MKNQTQAELASQANIEPQTLGKIERGEENPCLDTIESLCQALDTDLPLLLAPLPTKDPAEGPVLVDGRYLQRLRERLAETAEVLDAINATPASADSPYPPIKRRPRKPTQPPEDPPEDA